MSMPDWDSHSLCHRGEERPFPPRTIVDLIEAVGQSDRDSDLMALATNAIASSHGGDIRAYKHDLSGGFVLHSCQPAGNAAVAAQRLSGHWASGRHEPFGLNATNGEVVGWDGHAGTIFVPLCVDDSTEWLLTISGCADSRLGATVALLTRILSNRLTQLMNEAGDRLRKALRSLLTLGDAPFDAVARLALEQIAREAGALSAQVATYRQPQNPPALVIGWASPEDEAPPFVDAGTASTSSETITIGVALRSGMTAVLTLQAPPAGFSTGSARLAQVAADMLGVWLSGTMVRRSDVRTPAANEYSQELVGRLAGLVDRFGRLEAGGALAVVLPDVEEVTGMHLDEAIQAVQERVRSSDVVGIVGGGAGVLIPGAWRTAASVLADRLLKPRNGPDRVPLRVGVTTFPPRSASPEVLVGRALSKARWGLTA
jgi:hypothetical protein